MVQTQCLKKLEHARGGTHSFNNAAFVCRTELVSIAWQCQCTNWSVSNTTVCNTEQGGTQVNLVCHESAVSAEPRSGSSGTEFEEVASKPTKCPQQEISYSTGSFESKKWKKSHLWCFSHLSLTHLTNEVFARVYNVYCFSI